MPPQPPESQETTVTESRRKARRFTRDSILFTVGLLGIAYETAGHDFERPFLLMIFAGMVGLPAFIPRGDPPDGPTK